MKNVRTGETYTGPPLKKLSQSPQLCNYLAFITALDFFPLVCHFWNLYTLLAFVMSYRKEFQSFQFHLFNLPPASFS